MLVALADPVAAFARTIDWGRLARGAVLPPIGAATKTVRKVVRHLVVERGYER
jgi:hypothetical protein